ncbi:hypothetical protein N431DRAFT_454690 [Stipitochalara longipes BDJ]|nr:hypothetical protein N431DRAFT_454690 [Stipitochalara longipes BDJ]
MPSALSDKGEDEFLKFLKLPTEIRLKAGPRRAVTSTADKNNSIMTICSVSHPKPHVEANATSPELLHTNAEAREVATKHYKLAFNVNLNQRPIWFDFSTDILYLSDRLAATFFFEEFKSSTYPDRSNTV